MANAKLEAQGREITARVAAFAKDFEENESITEDEKETAWKALSADHEAYRAALARSEGAAELQAKLAAGGCGDVLDTKGNKVEKRYEVANPLARGGAKALAAEFLETEAAQEFLGFKDSFRKRLDAAMELGTKAATGYTENNNLMGEGVYGQGVPASQSGGFLGGAFGPGILPDYRPGIVEELLYELTIADLISSFGTTSPVQSYLTETQNYPGIVGYNSADTEPLPNWQANAQPEMGTSNPYPFSSTEFSRVYAQVGKIANAMTLSDESIADAPTLFNFVQGRLLTGLLRQEEVQILAGSGTFGAAAGDGGVSGLLSFGANFTAATSSSLYNGGTATTVSNVAFPAASTIGAGVASQTVSTLNVGRVITGAGSAYPDPLTVALNLKDVAVDIELSVFQSPNVHIMHPRDWQRLETAQDANEQFMNTSMFGNVYGVERGPVKRLWGVRVVTTPLIPVGYILTGWFDPQTVQIARRQGVQFQMTNSNESDFVQGRVTLRADSRLGLLCYRPTAFELTQLVAG
jgi:HK97 family phage major capsid protein